MKDYFNLSIEEKKELREKHDFRPEKFTKPVAEEIKTTTTTTELIQE